MPFCPFLYLFTKLICMYFLRHNRKHKFLKFVIVYHEHSENIGKNKLFIENKSIAD